MNSPGRVFRGWSEPDAAVDEATAADAPNSTRGTAFVPLRRDDLFAFSRQFSILRAEPIFIDIFKPTPYQTSEQFLHYFSPEKRPVWVSGQPGSPSAYFALHYIQRQHDLANLDFAFFSGYPSPGFEAAHFFWNSVRIRAAERGLTRLQSFVIASSMEKIRLLESFGFHKEGVLREHYFHDGKLHDVVAYAWLAEARRV
jgi:hypothetical protein